MGDEGDVATEDVDEQGVDDQTEEYTGDASWWYRFTPSDDEVTEHVPLTAAEEYMLEMHATDYAKGYTTTSVSYLPVTSTGESALFGDRELHDTLGLPEFITVAMDPTTNIVHQQFHPELIDAPFSNSGHQITVP